MIFIESYFFLNKSVLFRQTKDGLVDATPEVRKSLEDTLNKLKNAFGAESEDLLSVPKLDFKGKLFIFLHKKLLELFD